MPRKSVKTSRRTYSEQLKQEAVQMLLDGHSAASIMKLLDIPRSIYK